jgi:type II secretory pathway pseudopilin PulG
MVVCRLRYRAHGFTLIEVLVATTLTLMLVGAVVNVFSLVANSVSDARATVEMGDRLRATTLQLQRDLAGITVPMLPPRRPEDNEGYFEYVENSILAPSGSGAQTTFRPDSNYPYPASPRAVNTLSGSDDLTVGDTDDILMFTTRGRGRPFAGRYGVPTSSNNVLESMLAEVAWFVRGRTLYRRQLLIVPGITVPSNAAQFYTNYEISVHAEATRSGYRLVANSLGDLTKREYRFAHPFHAVESDRNRTRPASGHPNPFPYDVRRWGQLGLPTACETSSRQWWACLTFPTTGSVQSPGRRILAAIPRRSTVDLWSGADGIIADRGVSLAQAFSNANQYRLSNPWNASYWDSSSQLRCLDDVVLTNVIGFDVKVWDPGAPLYRRTVRSRTGNRTVVVAPGDPGYAVGSVAGYGAYVDLGYFPACPKTRGAPFPRFHVVNHDIAGGPRSGLHRTYDTWSTHYEYDGIPQWSGRSDWATDGYDNDRRNGVDDAGERDTQPPYPYPLRSLQVRIRVFDPDSRQIRETTIVEDFLPR